MMSLFGADRFEFSYSIFISISNFKQGVTGVPGGSVTNEPRDPCKRTCGTVVTHLGAYKSQLVVTIVPYIYIYIYIYICN